MYLLNNNRQWTEDAKGELNVPKQNYIFSHNSKIKHCTIQDYYVIKTENQLFSSTVYASQSTQVKSEQQQNKNTSLFAVILRYFSGFRYF